MKYLVYLSKYDLNFEKRENSIIFLFQTKNSEMSFWTFDYIDGKTMLEDVVSFLKETTTIEYYHIDDNNDYLLFEVKTNEDINVFIEEIGIKRYMYIEKTYD